MIKHMVMWRLKDGVGGATRAESAARIKGVLDALPAKIAVIRKLQVGINTAPGDAAADLALDSEFESQADLEAYIRHPEHVKAVDIIRPLVSERRVADYEF